MVRPVQLASVVVCLFSLGLLALTLWDGLTFLSCYDEATHILGGKMLDSGAVLYRGFVDSHGPFIFFLAQVYGLVAGWSHPDTARIINLVFVAMSIISIATSPFLDRATTRLWAVALFAGLLAAVWLRQGLFMVSFYPVAGALAGICLSSAVLPASPAAAPSRFPAFGAGLALVLLGTVAYSFAPTIIAFGAVVAWNGYASGRWRALRWFCFGGSVGIVLFLSYMSWFADWRGYLSFHFAESQFIYSRYIHFSFQSFFRSLELSVSPGNRINSLAVFCTAAGTVILSTLAVLQRQLRRLPSLFGILAGVLALNARGATALPDGAFVYTSIVLAAVSVASLLELLPQRLSFCATLAVLFLIPAVVEAVRPALYTPSGLDEAAMDRTPRWPIGAPSNGLFFQHIRQFAGPNERILALAYQPEPYLLADRLPINGFYAYFAWDADYAKAPWFGRPRDLCTTLKQAPPPVIVYSDYALWGYAPTSYIPCLLSLLKADYVEDTRIRDVHGRLFVRRDRAGALR